MRAALSIPQVSLDSMLQNQMVLIETFQKQMLLTQKKKSRIGESIFFNRSSFKENFNIFFDSGCSDFLITQDAVNRLGPNATMISKVPVSVGGLAGSQTVSDHGLYRVKLPLITGNYALLLGVCLEKLTEEFPQYPLGEAEKSLLLTPQAQYRKSFLNYQNLLVEKLT